MTIAFGSQGTTPSGTGTGTGTTSVTPAAPASMANGDYIVIAVFSKADTPVPSIPAGWRELGSVAGGGGTAGVDAGPVRVTAFSRIKASNWSSMPAITVTSASCATAQAFRYTNGTGFWSAEADGGTDTGSDTSWSVTAASNPGIKAGDMVLALTACHTDTITWSGQAVSATGISAWGTVTERSEPKTTQGNDIGGYVSEHPVTTGTASAAPVATATASAAATGATLIIRLRELTDPDIRGYSEAGGGTGSISTLTLSWEEATNGQGVPAGALALVTWTHNSAAVVTTNADAAGFDQTGLDDSGIAIDGSTYHELWKKVTDGTETGTFNLVVSVAARITGALTVIQGWDLHSTVAGGDTGSDASHTLPSATPTTNDVGVVITLGERSTSGTTRTTPPAGYDKIGFVSTFGSGGSFNVMAYEGVDKMLDGGHSSGVAINPGAFVNDFAATDVAMWTILLEPQTSGVTLSPTAIASGEALGSPTVTTKVDLSPTAIASAEAFGATVLTPKLTASPTAIGSAEALGSPTVSIGALTLSPTGIASAEAFGTVVRTSTLNLAPTAIASAEAVGTPVAQKILSITPTAIGSTEAFGIPALSLGSLGISPTSIPSGEALGSPTVTTRLTVSPTGIVSAEGVGSPVVLAGYTIVPTGIASVEAFGTAALTSSLLLSPSGVGSAQAFGNPTFMVDLFISPTGIISGEEFGDTAIITGFTLGPVGIETAEFFGTANMHSLLQVSVMSIDSGEAWGSPEVLLGALGIAPASITSLEDFGLPMVNHSQNIDSQSILSEEVFGDPAVEYGPMTIEPLSIFTDERWGEPALHMIIPPQHVVVVFDGIKPRRTHLVTIKPREPW